MSNAEFESLKAFTLEGLFSKAPFSVTQNAFYMWTKDLKRIEKAKLTITTQNPQSCPWSKDSVYAGIQTLE